MHRNRSNADRPTVSQQPQPQPQPAGAQPYCVQHDFDGPAELTTTLAHAISNVTGADVTDAGFTLNDYVDPDALDRLFRPKADGTPRGSGRVSFDVWGNEVTVHSSGQIVITPPPQQAPRSQGHPQGHQPR